MSILQLFVLNSNTEHFQAYKVKKYHLTPLSIKFKFKTSSATMMVISEEKSYPGLTWITHWATLSINFIFCILTCCHAKHNVHDEEKE